MSEKLQGWTFTEEIGMSISNPGSCIKITGSPKFMKAFVDYCEKEHPQWFVEKETDKEIASVFGNKIDLSKTLMNFLNDYPEFKNEENKET